MLPVVALVGRPNVGKSTLYNALTRSRDALVADLEGLTRDRRYGLVDSEDLRFIVIDTGGLTTAADGIGALTAQQVQTAIAESDVLVFMVDARAGMSAEDQRIAHDLRVTGKDVIVAANKTDGLDESIALSDFYSLGFESILPIAAAHRRGVDKLLARLRSTLALGDHLPSSEEQSDGIRVAIVGRPNVGKSTLINRLLGEERLLAHNTPGTTRDTVYVPWERDGQHYVLIDTAGIRRRARVGHGVEKLSVIKAIQAVQACDVAIVMIDATEGVVDQDSTILGLVLESGRALVIAVNKWDGLSPDQRRGVRAGVDRKFPFVAYAERVMISARRGSGFGELMTALRKAYRSASLEVSTAKLTEILTAAYSTHHPPMVAGRTAKLRYAHLGGHRPPRIVIHGSRTATLPISYRRYLSNVFRDRLNLTGTPVSLEFRDNENPYRDRKNTLTIGQVRKRKRMMKHVKKRKRK